MYRVLDLEYEKQKAKWEELMEKLGTHSQKEEEGLTKMNVVGKNEEGEDIFNIV